MRLKTSKEKKSLIRLFAFWCFWLGAFVLSVLLVLLVRAKSFCKKKMNKEFKIALITSFTVLLNYHDSFLLEFWNCPCITNFLPPFPSAYKTHQIYASCYDGTSVCSKRPRLTLLLCTVFIAAFFPWLHVEKFQSTEARQFFLRLRVMRRSVGIIKSHFVHAVFYMW